jgi:preprotein translocase subunit Sss1
MNLIQQFPNISRRERRKPVDHGPDNKEFKKQLRRDAMLILLIGLISACGIIVTMSLSVKGGW